MAFDLDRFNLIPFNASSTIRYLRVTFAEEVTTVMGVDTDLYPRCYYNERVDAEINGAPGRFLDAVSGTETVSEQVTDFISIHYLVVSGTENVDKDLNASSDTYLTAMLSEEVSEETAMGQKVCLTNPMEENVDADTAMGQNLWLTVEGYELINESASLIVISEKVCYIGTPDNPFTLKPGEKLIIDASTYNVLLDGENAIWYQAGDWLDELNRNTLDINITASAGLSNLSATILYTELFL